MAVFFVKSLSKKSRVVLKTLELMLLSAGLISTLLVVKGAVLPISSNFDFSSLSDFPKIIKCFLTSYILIIINFIIVMISILSSFRQSETNAQDRDSIRVDTGNFSSAPPPSAPYRTPPPSLYRESSNPPTPSSAPYRESKNLPTPSAPYRESNDLPPLSTPRKATRAAVSQPPTPQPWGVDRDNLPQPPTPRHRYSKVHKSQPPTSWETTSQPSTPRRYSKPQPSAAWEVNRDDTVSQPSTTPARYERDAVYQSSTPWGFDGDTLSQPSTPHRYTRDAIYQSSTPWEDTRYTVSQPSTPQRYARDKIPQSSSTPRGDATDTVHQPSTPRGYYRSTVSQPSTPQHVSGAVLPPYMTNSDATYMGVPSSPPTRKRISRSSNSKKLNRGSNLKEFLNYLNHGNTGQKYFEQDDQFSEASSYMGRSMSKSQEIKNKTNSVNSSSYFSESRKVKMGPKYPLTVSVEHEEHDSMEATWRAINGLEQRQRKKQLKKSETWEVPPRTSNASIERLDSEDVIPSSPTWKELRKSETFNDAVSMKCRGGLQRDHSFTSLVDFNKRVDDFINKGKAFMKLQRQESYNRRNESMIHR